MNIESLREAETMLKGFRDALQVEAKELTSHKVLREHMAGEDLSNAADFIHMAIRRLEIEEEERIFE